MDFSNSTLILLKVLFLGQLFARPSNVPARMSGPGGESHSCEQGRSWYQFPQDVAMNQHDMGALQPFPHTTRLPSRHDFTSTSARIAIYNTYATYTAALTPPGRHLQHHGRSAARNHEANS